MLRMDPHFTQKERNTRVQEVLEYVINRFSLNFKINKH